VHAGGFVLGDLDASHASSIAIARGVGAVVVSVDYRLAPENPFPAGLEDCYAALSWFSTHAAELGVDPERIAIHGGSAGGGLCAALALLACDRSGPSIAFQYLGIPELDDRLTTSSMTTFVDTPMLNRPTAIHSWDAYLGPGRRGTDSVPPYAAPAGATDLSGLPPAYISARANAKPSPMPPPVITAVRASNESKVLLSSSLDATCAWSVVRLRVTGTVVEYGSADLFLERAVCCPLSDLLRAQGFA
jgi:acetyl esterase/lipase